MKIPFGAAELCSGEKNAILKEQPLESRSKRTIKSPTSRAGLSRRALETAPRVPLTMANCLLAVHERLTRAAKPHAEEGGDDG